MRVVRQPRKSIVYPQETMSMKAGGAVIAGHRVGHIAHLAGAFVGVLLVWSLSRLPAVSKH